MNLSRLAALCLVAASTLGTAFAGPIDAEHRAKLQQTILDRVTRLAFVPGEDFSRFTKILEKYQPRIDKVETEDDFASIMNQALGDLGHSHFAVISPDANKARADGTRTGIGIYTEIVSDGIAVKGVIPNSPAEKAGLEDGDVITLVDGKKPTSTEAFAGPIGTSFSLSVKNSKGVTRKLNVTRAVFSMKEEESLKWLNPEVAVLRVPSFEKYDAKNVAKLMDEAAKAKVLAVDMRGNPGGYVFNMLNFSSFVLPQESKMGTMVNRYAMERFVKETSKPATDLVEFAKWTPNQLKPSKTSRASFDGTLVAFVDGGTGSAAEIMSAAMRDVKGAYVIGQKSIGMVLAATITPLQDGFSIMIPIQDYITVKGLRLEKNGVKPDEEVITGNKRGKADDPCYQALLRYASSLTLRNR